MKGLYLLMVLLLVLAVGCVAANPSPAPPASSPAPAITAPASSVPAPKPQVKGTFIEGDSGGDAETLNWILAADASSFGYAGLTIDSLATYDNDWNVVLRHLAKPVEISADGLLYTITIRDDLKWSDGTKVTSEDYVYTLKNLMCSDWLNYPYKSNWEETVDGKTVFVQAEVVNDTTFTIKRQTVDPEFVDNALYSFTPYPKNIAKKYEGDIKAFTQAPEFNDLTYTGNLGPYKFNQWVRDDKFLVDRNPDFYLGKQDSSPYFEKYEIKLFGTPAALYAALEAGDITSTGLEPEQVARFKQMSKIKVYTRPTGSYDLIILNERNNGWEGLKNKQVRQALAMSISKKQVIDSIRLGFADPAFSFIPKPSPWYSEEGVPQFGYGALYDKEKAKQILVDAGFGTKKPDGTLSVLDKDGKPLKLTLATSTGSNISENLAFLVKQELSGLGIDVDIKLVPWPTLLRQYVMNKTAGSNQEPGYNNGPNSVSEQPWDMIIMAFNTNAIAPSGSKVFFGTQGGLNFWGYSDTKVDDLFQRVITREAINRDVRKQIYAEVSRTIADDQPVIFLTFPRGNSGFQANVAGIVPGMNMSWNFHKWYFAQP